MADPFRALVVDDDAIARKTVMFALQQENFQCDFAIDGDDALRRVSENHYDLVVTDLRMPNKHGHALSVELLGKEPRPIIVVHSSVDDPRLTRDLMTRGVDDIVSKPTNYAAFAAKVKGMVSRRRERAGGEQTPENKAGDPPAAAQQAPDAAAAQPAADGFVVSLADFESNVSMVSRILPVSQTALDVFQMTRSDCDTPKLGAAIQQDAALAAEVLSIANSSFYNASGAAITEMEKAVVRIGRQRIGELALAAATLSTLTKNKLPWMDMDVVWRQSIAAGVAVEHLVKQGKHGPVGGSLAIIAIMNSLGRVVLGTLYPNHYRHLIQQCSEQDEPLVDQEDKIFPENQAAFMTRLLAVWNLPEELRKPLPYIQDSYAALARLSDPTRTQAELVKLAVFIGRLATRAWHAWDTVEIPPAALLKRLRIQDVKQVLENTRADAQTMIDAKADAVTTKTPASTPPARESAGALHYENASISRFDFIAQLLENLDVTIAREATGPAAKMLINGIGVPRHNPPAALARPNTAKWLVIGDGDQPGDFALQAEILKTPASYGKLRTVVLSVSTPAAQAEPAAV